MGNEFPVRGAAESGGIGTAFIIGKTLSGGPSALVLGDNVFYGHGLPILLEAANSRESGATIFAYPVSNPKDFGVVEVDENYDAVSIQEKPEVPRSNPAVTGLYYYDEQVCDFAAELKPSPRGELEITDINRRYLANQELHVQLMGRGYAWLDTGTHDSLLDAGSFIATLQKRQGLQVACPEEIAHAKGWIDDEQLLRLAEPLLSGEYGAYLKRLVK